MLFYRIQKSPQICHRVQNWQQVSANEAELLKEPRATASHALRTQTCHVFMADPLLAVRNPRDLSQQLPPAPATILRPLTHPSHHRVTQSVATAPSRLRDQFHTAAPRPWAAARGHPAGGTRPPGHQATESAAAVLPAGDHAAERPLGLPSPGSHGYRPGTPFPRHSHGGPSERNPGASRWRQSRDTEQSPAGGCPQQRCWNGAGEGTLQPPGVPGGCRRELAGPALRRSFRRRLDFFTRLLHLMNWNPQIVQLI